ncbi:hypothetical protein YC2023_002250 [Brassica napus]
MPVSLVAAGFGVAAAASLKTVVVRFADADADAATYYIANSPFFELLILAVRDLNGVIFVECAEIILVGSYPTALMCIPPSLMQKWPTSDKNTIHPTVSEEVQLVCFRERRKREQKELVMNIVQECH